MAGVQAKLGALATLGLSQAMRQRWVAVDKAKAPVSAAPAADGDVKKDKGENDRIVRKVPSLAISTSLARLCIGSAYGPLMCVRWACMAGWLTLAPFPGG